jgi:mRNA-degrading endonuclease RelE of RelBE toxin-antitoxin system
MAIEWKIEFTPLARRHLDELEDRVRIEAMRTIADLREDPFPPGHVQLRGYRDVHRIRFYRDQYRLLYRVSEQQRKVIVWRVRPRGSAYAGL